MTLHDLGKDIREQREKAGLSIDDVATRIKVSARTLQAIENGAVESLPHAVYTKGFVRSYAMVVGFDVGDLNARLEEAFPPEGLESTKADMGPLVRPSSSSGFFKKFFLLVLVLGVLSGIGFGVWYVTTKHGTDIWEFVKQPFSAVTTPAPHTAPGYAEQPVDLAEQVSPAVAGLLPMSQSGAFAGEVQASRPVGASAASLAGAVPEGSGDVSAQNAAGNPETQASEALEPAVGQEQSSTSGWPLLERQFVFVKADQECWIGVRKDAARMSEHGTIYPGQVWIFSFKNFLELNLGNAGGVVLQHNGKALGSLGREKEARTVRFTPSGFSS
jgi:cytoskeleton protein RodZ